MSRTEPAPTTPEPITTGRITTQLTIADALRHAAAELAEIADTARLDAEILMAHALGMARSRLLLHHMHDQVPAGFDGLIARRKRHEPVAYITGHQEFYGLDFKVTPDVLIPRADSETVIEQALAIMPARARILDCGVGSGALLLAVLAHRPQAHGIGVDCCPKALGVAIENAKNLRLAGRAEFFCRDWHRPDWAAGLGRFDLVLANPPYVEDNASLECGVAGYEPHGALYAGPDGLAEYQVLIPQLRRLMQPGGQAVIEIGRFQGDAVSTIAEMAGFSARIYPDLAGRPRVIVLK